MTAHTAIAGHTAIADTATLMNEMGRAAKSAATILAVASTERKNAALLEAAKAMIASEAAILAANAEDMAAGREKGLTPPCSIA